jgi:hypothetical protein
MYRTTEPAGVGIRKPTNPSMMATCRALMLMDKRIELPVHYDWWMRGARYGVVTSIGKDARWVYVKLDALPANAKRIKLWALDYEYAIIRPAG